MQQAIVNLLDNAADTDSGPVEINVDWDEHWATLRIRDRGPGIAPEERELIFQRFWRRDRNQQGSTGLGLSIVQRIVELHGASIVVENRVLGGAEFSLHFVSADKTA